MKPRSIPPADDTSIRHTQIADGICRLSLFNWAQANGLKYAGVTRSFRRANVYGGPEYVDYRLDAVGVLAWLYWRENNGRLPWALFDGRAYV